MSQSKQDRSNGAIRDVTINIRAKRGQRDLIDRAASAQGKSRSEFMLDSAYQKAQDVLLDQVFFELDEEKFRQFTEILDGPPNNRDSLRRLLTSAAPWD